MLLNLPWSRMPHTYSTIKHSDLDQMLTRKTDIHTIIWRCCLPRRRYYWRWIFRNEHWYHWRNSPGKRDLPRTWRQKRPIRWKHWSDSSVPTSKFPQDRTTSRQHNLDADAASDVSVSHKQHQHWSLWEIFNSPIRVHLLLGLSVLTQIGVSSSVW